MSLRKSDVVNISGGVQTADGRTLYGLDAEIYKKMQQKEDPNFERKIGEWIEDTLSQTLTDTSNLWASLKSGVVLCKLVNKLRPGILKKFNDKPTLHVLEERENIQLYLASCEKLGIDKSNLFAIDDLHSRKSMSAVLQNLHALSRSPFSSSLSSSSGNISIPNTPRRDINKKYKWDVSYQNKPIYAEELPEDPQSALIEVKRRLEESIVQIQKLSQSNEELKQDLSLARQRLRDAQLLVSPTSIPSLWIDWWKGTNKKSLLSTFYYSALYALTSFFKLWYYLWKNTIPLIGPLGLPLIVCALLFYYKEKLFLHSKEWISIANEVRRGEARRVGL